jgi:hypothetical protein
VLLRPLPYRDPGKLVRVYTEFPTMDLKKFWMSPPEFLDIQNEADSWESIGAWTTTGRNVATSTDEPVRVTAALITRGLIDALGVQPAVGATSHPKRAKRRPQTALISTHSGAARLVRKPTSSENKFRSTLRRPP